METIPESLAIARQLHQAGRLAGAERICRWIIAADPDQAEAWHRLGLIAHRAGKHEAAAGYVERAIRLTGDVATLHRDLGVMYRAAGRVSAAIVCYRRALELEPSSAEAHYNLGNALREQGQLDEATVCFRRAVELEPRLAEAHGNLGAALRERGEHTEAVACFRRAAELRPDDAAAHGNLGVALRDLGRVDESIASFRRALELEPGAARVYNDLGLALQDQGKPAEAVAAYRRAVELQPGFAAAHFNLGNALKDNGHLDDSVAAYRRALELDPEDPAIHNNLGSALWGGGCLDEAIACYRRALELKPDGAEAHTNLGVALHDRGELDGASACHRRALELRPGYAEAYSNLGNALKDRGRLDESLACYRRAIELRPNLAEAHNNLGTAFGEQGALDEAVACYRRAIELTPGYAAAYNNLGNALRDQGRLDEALACYQRAMALEPGSAGMHSNFLCALQYRAGATPGALAEAHVEFDRRHAESHRRAFAGRGNATPHGGPLRLGFVSRDLGQHPVGYFLVRALENLGHEGCETICYSDRAVSDDLTGRLRAAVARWRDVLGASDRQLAEQVHADGVDILFDLAGHTARNRMLAFARKPAPLQIAWIGYEGTTGLSAMDYLLADRHMVPEGAEHDYREQVLRMPDGYLCYDPPHGAPPVGPLLAHRPGEVTLGSFNNPAKITPDVVSVWAEILRRLPGGRLVLKYRGLGGEGARQRYREMFSGHGVAPERVALLPRSAFHEYLAAYQKIDLALDPFPFSGSATTCEALWMGVPVVTCPGETFASRHSLSHLSNVGLTETIARSLDEYVEIAVALANDLPRLAAIRARLREQMAASPLCDGPRFAKNLAALLRDVWRRWCESQC